MTIFYVLLAIHFFISGALATYWFWLTRNIVSDIERLFESVRKIERGEPSGYFATQSEAQAVIDAYQKRQAEAAK